MTIEMTTFARRQFASWPACTFSGTVIRSHSPESFAHYVNLILDRNAPELVPGYAPFCKLLFVRNFTDARPGSVEITPENERQIVSEYAARRDTELPVLSRYLPSKDYSQAAYLGIVLYDSEQLLKEGEHIEADYGIVAILGQNTNTEEPMTPITMMRNALGIQEGGSGHPLDRDKYLAAVEFWKRHVIVRYE